MKLSSLIETKDDQIEHRKELTEGKFLEILKGQAKNAHVIATKIPFFRQDSGSDMMLVTPAAKEERSTFWIDRLIKEIPAWGKMPSRSRFLKAYTNFERTFGGDDVYVMIPLDGTRVGVAPGPTFYRSFTDIKKSLGFEKTDNQTFIDWLTTIQEGLAQITDTKIKKIEPTTFTQFQKGLAQIDEILKTDREILKKNLSVGEGLSDLQAKTIKDLLARHITNTERYLTEKLDPEVNGFHAVRIESFSKSSGDHEVWVDSPVLLIKRSTYIEMHKSGTI